MEGLGLSMSSTNLEELELRSIEILIAHLQHCKVVEGYELHGMSCHVRSGHGWPGN